MRTLAYGQMSTKQSLIVFVVVDDLPIFKQFQNFGTEGQMDRTRDGRDLSRDIRCTQISEIFRHLVVYMLRLDVGLFRFIVYVV